jgi:hypothetical protein
MTKGGEKIVAGFVGKQGPDRECGEQRRAEKDVIKIGRLN